MPRQTMNEYTCLPANIVTYLHHGLLHGLDDALLDHHARLGSTLEGLLGRPLRTQWHPQRPLVLCLGLKLMRQLTGHILGVLKKD